VDYSSIRFSDTRRRLARRETNLPDGVTRMIRIKCVSWNVHGGVSSAGQTFDYLEPIQASRPSIAALQEVQVSPGDKGIGDWKRRVASIGLNSAISVQSPSPFSHSRQLAIALLSRFPILAWHEELFPNPVAILGLSKGFHDKGALTTTVTMEGNLTVDIVTIHLYPFHMLDVDERDSKFAELWLAIDDALRPRPRVPRIVLGDFNTEHRTVLLPSLKDGSLTSLFSGIATRENSRSHDDILISTDLEVADCSVMKSESDHYILNADLELR
jgi:endonuclease/exonuclease/phosphatase family metal-dependent hydrolase